MADTNYIIAIGGTGARVARALIHICDCGHLNIKEIKLLVIDPDTKNGSKYELQRVLELYESCRSVLFNETPDESCAMFKPKISKALSGNRFANEEWCVSPVQGAPGQVAGNSEYHLNDYVIHENIPVAEHFMKALYSREEYEDKNMYDGFFAHPSIGAHTFARWLNNSPEFASFLAGIQEALHKGNVKIAIVGSSFGGTGASGFTNVARKIRSFADALQGKGNNKVIISGEFFLPYFIFLPTDDKNEEIPPDRRIDIDEFLKAAKNAAAFYSDTNASDVFDRVTALGTPGSGSVRIVRNIYADKGERQDNWPHMLEVFGALEIKGFLEEEDSACINNDTPVWRGIGVDQTSFNNITWNDLPHSGGMRDLLNKFLLYSYIYVPAVLDKFIARGSKNYTLKNYRNEGRHFSPINRRPFTKVNLFGQSTDWDIAFDEDAIERFINLNHYFFKHSQWLCRLFSEFEHDPNKGYGDPLFTSLINRDILLHRATNPWNTSIYHDNLGNRFIGNYNFTYAELNADIDREVKKQIKSDHNISGATGELLRGVYAQVAKRFR
ncbi:MAG: hypothetical protein LBQ68_06245 [Clostridiales bacterium]|nr:hypothetical protein [Clostridiales bacterium]